MSDNNESPALNAAAPEPPATPEVEPAAPESHPGTRKHRKHKKHLNLSGTTQWLLLLLIAGALAFLSLYQQPRQLTRLHKDMAALEKQIQQQQQDLAAATTRQGELLSRYEADAATWNSQLSGLTEDNRMLQENLVTLGDKLGTNDTQWKLAEVEYLLQTANHRLQLERDVGTAHAALLSADERLQRLSDPRFTELRGVLAKDIQALAGVSVVDTTGLVMELSALENAVADLPLVAHSQFEFAAPAGAVPEVSADSPWMSTLRTAWHDITQLVVIRRRDKPVEPLMPPDEQALLLDNMRLQLAAARIAVLKGDSANLHLQVTKVISWLQSYFDKDHGAVGAMVASLEKYRGLELRPELPDISGSLLSLRRWKAEHAKNNR